MGSALTAKAQIVEPRYKSKLEYEYSLYLTALKSRGEILWWRYEGISIKLADGAKYTPDFAVVNSAGELEFHETKGHWREAARVRIRVAAELNPFRFVAITRGSQGWQREEFPCLSISRATPTE